MNYQTLKIKCAKASIGHHEDGVELMLIGCDTMEVLEQLLYGANQQGIISRVQEIVKEWEEAEEIDNLVNQGL